jgi:hypothetical protein
MATKLMKHQTDTQTLAQVVTPGSSDYPSFFSRRPSGKVRTRLCAPPQRLNAPVHGPTGTKRAPLCGRNIRRPPHKMAARLRVSGLFSSNGNLPFFKATQREYVPGLDSSHRRNATLPWDHGWIPAGSSRSTPRFLFFAVHAPRSSPRFSPRSSPRPTHTTYTTCHDPVPDRRVQCPHRESAHASWVRPAAAICGL